MSTKPLWRYLITRFLPCRDERQTEPGQALVEMALSITLLFLLVAAAVDLGLAYKTHQTLVNATAEASSYLDLNPTLPAANPIQAANAIALQRFQREQGVDKRPIASTLDLNANGIADNLEAGFNIADWVQITEAGSDQVGNMNTYDPSQTAAECQERRARPTSVTSCYIVIRSRIIYRPFFLNPILGDEMTIRTTSVRRIVKGTV